MKRYMFLMLGIVSIEAMQREYNLESAFHDVMRTYNLQQAFHGMIHTVNERFDFPHDQDLLKTQLVCDSVIAQRLAKAHDVIRTMDTEEDRWHFAHELNLLHKWKRCYIDTNINILNQHSCSPSQACQIRNYKKILEGARNLMVRRAQFIDKLVEVVEAKHARASRRSSASGLLKKIGILDIERASLKTLLQLFMEVMAQPYKNPDYLCTMHTLDRNISQRMAEARQASEQREIEDVQGLKRELQGLRVLRMYAIDHPMDTMQFFSGYTVPEKVHALILEKAQNIDALMAFKWGSKK